MSFCCFVPGQPIIQSSAFKQVSENRWVVELSSATPINDLAAFITQPLAADQALGCHIASAPFEQAQWHYLGSISNETPSVVFKTRYVWSARDAVPTAVQFGVELQHASQLAATPPEKVSAEVLEARPHCRASDRRASPPPARATHLSARSPPQAARRIGQDLYDFAASFDILPAELLNKWLARFTEKCKRDGLDWLSSVG